MNRDKEAKALVLACIYFADQFGAQSPTTNGDVGKKQAWRAYVADRQGARI